MKADKILFVSDDNPQYYTFWPSISQYYKTYFGLDCKLFFIGEKTDQNEEYLTGDVQIVPPIPDIPVIIQALWGKFWFTQTEPDTNWIIGDIDMYFFRKDYIFNSVDKIPDDGYGHLDYRGDNYYMGYLHCAKGSTFKKYLQLSPEFETDCRLIFESKRYGMWRTPGVNIERVKDKKDWQYITCEEHLSNERLLEFSENIYKFEFPKEFIRFESPHAAAGFNTPRDFNFVSAFFSMSPEFRKRCVYLHASRPYSFWKEQYEEIINYQVSH
jgi:hypothetical protein